MNAEPTIIVFPPIPFSMMNRFPIEVRQQKQKNFQDFQNVFVARGQPIYEFIERYGGFPPVDLSLSKPTPVVSEEDLLEFYAVEKLTAEEKEAILKLFSSPKSTDSLGISPME